ncbi:hypothetical protein GH714_004391 [Hevea brasiliensis]|uniref:indole-3-acetaldehyde oxidase n=1 Tax=Hevea brasiliensis TaxID=3981 RepID=A0A6A6LJM8_HEVBR|nr:hypothetical protein GH714_004391 [Hevea brasiliensis]
MEEESEMAKKGHLVFAVNGQRFELFTVDPSMTLLEFLRTQTPFKSVKLGCGEGLGNSKVGFHSIHKRFSGFHASQCGFCTPGMCMSLFGALVNAEKTDRPEPSPGYSKLTVLEAEKAIAGNLCRCTGYRPIADACKSFASDVDMEDLGFNSFWKKGERHEVNISGLPLYNRNHEICTFPAFLKREVKASMLIDSKRCSWNQPSSFQELQGLLKSYDANNGVRMKLVGDHTGIEIGASVTISKAIEALREESKGEFISASKLVFKKIAGHMEKVAAKFIRNIGSIGGNLVMAQGKHFPSDIATILLAAGSFVHIINGVIHEKLTLEEFLERPPLDSKSVLISVRIPNCGSIKDVYPEGDSKLFFETYRAAPRPLGNALPYLNAAFLAEVSCSKSSNGIMMNSCQLAFGAFGTKHAIRARKVEEFLTGNWLTNAVLCEAIKLVKATVVPDDGTSDPAYRSSLAVGFLFDFLGQLVDSSSNGWLKGYSGISMLEDVISKEKYDNLDHVKYPTLLSSSKQVIELNKEYHPIGEPITKSGSALQASGEAVYVDDIPSPGNCLYGSFIYSTKPFARIKGIRFNSKSLPDGVTALVSFKDIPKGGQNIGLLLSFGPERLFADELTQYAGEPVAFVLADSQKHADVGAKLAVVDYDLENLESPILTVEEAVERSSLFEIPPVICPKQVGDFSKGIAEADHKILSAKIKLGSQYYFYMENQTALAVPDEDNCMVVYSSIQCPEYAQAAIAKCLGVPEHNVRVLTRRVGGGFGGKVTKSMPVATACALAAHKYQRPVRISMNRKTDMIMAGGRHPMKITYSVGFKSNGKITALYLDILIDAGISLDISPMMPKAVVGALKKYNWGALSFDIKLCKTNLSSKSAMRGPGDLQGSYIAEAIIEQVASFLSVDADSVRAINFHTYDSLKLFYDVSAGDPLEYTLTSIWDKLATSACFNQRTQMIKEFNRYNIWKKRGISRIPCVYDVSMRPTPGKVSILHDGSIVVEVGGIELGQGLWTKAYLEAVNLSVNSFFIPDFASKQYLNYGGSRPSDRANNNFEIRYLYDCGQSLNPAVDLGQIEGAFVQGIGFFMLEEYTTNSDGLIDTEGTRTYKIPTIDTIPKQLNVALLHSGRNPKRVLSSKASGEPPLLLAASVHCATKAAISEARKQLHSWGCLDGSHLTFQVGVPATMPIVKELCGLDVVERYLQCKVGRN